MKPTLMIPLILALQIPLVLASASKKASRSADEHQGEKTMPKPLKAPAVPGQYLISFETSVTDDARAMTFEKWKVKELEKVGTTPLFLIELSMDTDSEKTLNGLRAEKGVRYVEPNFTMKTFGP